MHILIIGAGGYIGSAVARNLQAHGHTVSGLARNREAEARIAAAGIKSARGSFADLPGLGRIAAAHDAVVFVPFVPFEDEPPALEALLAALEGTNKPLVYTSGTGVLSIEARAGQWHQENFAEDDSYEPRHWLSLRVKTENLVRQSADRGVRGMVVRPPLIWGHGGSKQIPAIFESVKKTGSACYIGAGLNLYTHVHIDDVAELFRLALLKGASGALYHAVAGEVNWRTMAEAVAEAMNCKARSVTFEEGCDIWGSMIADLFFAVSSRSRAVRSRSELGWAPTIFDVVEDIRHGSYRKMYAAAANGTAAAL